MKISLKVNLSMNGQVILLDNLLHQLPDEAITDYVMEVNLAGAIIIGKNTYNTFQQMSGGIRSFFPIAEIAVLSSSLRESKDIRVFNDVDDALSFFRLNRFERVIVGGGNQVFNEFLNRELGDEICITYVPIIIGSGGIIGQSALLNTKYKMLNRRDLSNSINQVSFSRVEV